MEIAAEKSFYYKIGVLAVEKYPSLKPTLSAAKSPTFVMRSHSVKKLEERNQNAQTSLGDRLPIIVVKFLI